MANFAVTEGVMIGAKQIKALPITNYGFVHSKHLRAV